MEKKLPLQLPINHQAIITLNKGRSITSTERQVYYQSCFFPLKKFYFQIYFAEESAEEAMPSGDNLMVWEEFKMGR